MLVSGSELFVRPVSCRVMWCVLGYEGGWGEVGEAGSPVLGSVDGG